MVAVKAYETKYDQLKLATEEQQDKMNTLKLACENRNVVDRPKGSDEKAVEKFEKVIEGFANTNDDAESRLEREFAMSTKIVL